jgi:pantetheine-phosphate adenylyltransferase
MADPSRAHPARHALFPGSFDPFTLGHLDLVRRASRIFPRLTIGVARNPEKQALFDPEERAEMAREATRGIAGVEVALIAGLVVHACRELGADVVVRGVRSGSDFDYEAQMARTNRVLAPEVDTLLLAPAPEHAHLSSTLVRQIAALGGDASALVPQNVARALQRKFPDSRS